MHVLNEPADKEDSVPEDELLISEDDYDSFGQSGKSDPNTDCLSSRDCSNCWKNSAPDKRLCLQSNTLTLAPGLTNYCQNFQSLKAFNHFLQTKFHKFLLTTLRKVIRLNHPEENY